MKRLSDELRAKYPERAARASKSAKSAIRLFCIECCGGEAGEARRCQVRDCFLWPHVKAWRAPQAVDGDTPEQSEADAIEQEDVLEQEDALGQEDALDQEDALEDGSPDDEAKPAPLAASTAPAGRRPPPPRAKAAKEQGPPLDRTPGALVGKTLRHAEQDGTFRECVVTERGFEYAGQVYTSISAAAKAASGRKAANGWEYWS